MGLARKISRRMVRVYAASDLPTSVRYSSAFIYSTVAAILAASFPSLSLELVTLAASLFVLVKFGLGPGLFTCPLVFGLSSLMRDGLVFPSSITWTGLLVAGLILSFGLLLRRSYDHSEGDRRGLQEALRIRDEFLAMAAHELRTPLSTLKLQIHSLQRFGKQADISKADRQINRIDDLISSLMDVVRMKDGKLDFKPTKFDFCEMISELLVRMKPDLELRGCHVALDLPSCPMTGYWDRMRMEQVLTNLLINAAKYAPGHIVIRIDGDDKFTRLVIQDHGPGIPPEKLPSLFKKFGRVSEDKTISGLGLGLWIVNQIVEAHLGTIRVNSEVGKGTTFTVVLPRTRY